MSGSPYISGKLPEEIGPRITVGRGETATQYTGVRVRERCTETVCPLATGFMAVAELEKVQALAALAQDDPRRVENLSYTTNLITAPGARLAGRPRNHLSNNIYATVLHPMFPRTDEQAVAQYVASHPELGSSRG